MINRQLTIIINTFNSSDKIFSCLNSISSKYKVLVIENSNDIDFKKKLEKKYKNVKCYLTKQNLGYAKGNNLGLSKVKTSYALIINPDAILQKETINNFFKTANKIKEFAIIGPAIQDEKNLTNNLNNLTEVNSIKGFAMFLNIKEFKNIGFFDENFFIYLEEIDLCRRLKKNNKKIYVDPTILIAHQGGSSHEEEYNFEMELSRNWHWMWSTFYFKKKYNGYLFALSSVLGKIISSIVKYIFYFFLHNKRKRLIYKHRFLGLYNSILGKPSWYRPHNN